MSPESEIRKYAMGVLAKADAAALDGLWAIWPDKPVYDWLRRPETGLVMVRGRMGGTGAAFNLGEMTITRCAVRLAGGTAGYAYVQGRAPRKAEIAAVVDALYQSPEIRPRIDAAILEPLADSAAAAQRCAAAETAATKVDFFTMVRDGGE